MPTSPPPFTHQNPTIRPQPSNGSRSTHPPPTNPDRRGAPSGPMTLLATLLTLAIPLALASPAAADRPTWRWPLDGHPKVLRRLAPPPEPWLPGHRGIDLATAPTTPVVAAGPGIVRFAGALAGRGGGHHRARGWPAHDISACQRISTPRPTRNARHPPRRHRTPHWPLPRKRCPPLGPPARLPLLDPLLLLGRARIRLLPYWNLDALGTLAPSRRSHLPRAPAPPPSNTHRRSSFSDNHPLAGITASATSAPAPQPHPCEPHLRSPHPPNGLPLLGTFRFDTGRLSHQRGCAVQRAAAVHPDPPSSMYAHGPTPRRKRPTPQTAAPTAPTKTPPPSENHQAMKAMWLIGALFKSRGHVFRRPGPTTEPGDLQRFLRTAFGQDARTGIGQISRQPLTSKSANHIHPLTPARAWRGGDGASDLAGCGVFRWSASDASSAPRPPRGAVRRGRRGPAAGIPARRPSAPVLPSRRSTADRPR